MTPWAFRPALDEIAECIAVDGYAVLVPDTLYRGGRFGPFDAKTAFKDEATGSLSRRMFVTTQAMTQADTAALSIR